MTGGTDGTGANGHAPSINTPNPTYYTYDQLDNLLKVSQSVQTRTFVYNSLSQLTSATLPESGVTSYTYTNFGLVNTRTDARNVVTTYGYDNLNRLSSVSYNTTGTTAASTPTVTYFYDEGGAAANALGRLTHFTDGVGSETYSYNSLGQTVSMSKAISSVTYPVSYAYNLAGDLASITYPSGRIVQPSYDAVGRLSQLASGGTNYVANLQYNSASEPLSFTYGNGVQAAFTYNSRLQLASLAYTKGTGTIFSSNYYYSTDAGKCPAAPAGNNGQIQCIADNVDGTRSATYSYDAWARLKTAVTSQWGLKFAYDRFGNRTQQVVTSGTGVPSNSLTIAPATNRVTGATYDLAGNMTNNGVNTLVYDAENHVTSATQSSGSGTYTMDGNGLRVKKVSGSTTTVYIFSGSKVIAEYENGVAVSAPSREYLYVGVQVVAKVEAGATNYFHPDHLSTRANTDSSGTVSRTFGQYPFGEVWYETGTANKLKFTTYERDSESGNDYAMARSYINRYGRFTSADPLAGSLADPQTLARYTYSRNDPINMVDPFGLFPSCLYIVTGIYDEHPHGDYVLCYDRDPVLNNHIQDSDRGGQGDDKNKSGKNNFKDINDCVSAAIAQWHSDRLAIKNRMYHGYGGPGVGNTVKYFLVEASLLPAKDAAMTAATTGGAALITFVRTLSFQAAGVAAVESFGLTVVASMTVHMFFDIPEYERGRLDYNYGSRIDRDKRIEDCKKMFPGQTPTVPIPK